MENQDESNRMKHEPLLIDLNANLVEEVDECPILNASVRKTYFKHIVKILKNNAAHTETQLSEKDILDLAQKIELDALKISMSTNLYRFAILNEVQKIKCLTDYKIPVSADLYKLSDTDDPGSDNSSNLSDQRCVSSNGQCDKASVTENDVKSNGFVEQHNHTELVKEENMKIGQDSANFIQTKLVKVENGINNGLDSSESVEQNIHTKPIKVENEINDEISVDSTVEMEIEEENENGRFNKVLQEMEQMFSTNDAGTASATPNTESPNTPLNVSSSNRFFSYKNPKFWSLEYEMIKAQFQQKISTIHEINQQKYNKIQANIENIFHEESSTEKEDSPVSLKQVTYKCKERITWHVKNCLNVYYKKKRITSADQFRKLAKSLVANFLQLDPFMGHKYIYRAISKFFEIKKTVIVQNSKHIRYVVARIKDYISQKINKRK